ncbi:MAG TPA: non-ribosomal peptide synthetase [Gammaproteobacteria bacterium]|nr:non-ribosomal peptide synthetase [Gammaproteobacteria bacterium]
MRGSEKINELSLAENTVSELFHWQAKRNPTGISAVYKGKFLTYEELDQKSTILSMIIRDYYDPNQGEFIVAMLMERDLNMIISILAILKAGGAFLPLDTEYPSDRISYILSDAKPHLLLTHKNLIDKLKGTICCPILKADDIANIKYNSNSQLEKFFSQKLNYIIYTSGSTGNPKGVMVEKRSLMNYLKWANKYLNVKLGDRFDCSSSLAFDFTITTLLLPVISGATIIFCDEKTKRDPCKYLKHLEKYRINIVKLVPTFFNLLCDLQNNCSLVALQSIVLGGENASSTHVKKWLHKYPCHKIYNEYGPTETTVGVTLSTYGFGETFDDITIGCPGLNTRIYVLDEFLQPLQPMTIGEIFISGHCVARGYLNCPELTAEKFIPNPFSMLEEGYSVIYKTGDLGCLLENGSFKYIGRIDDQIKINGYRVELGEVERLLNQHSQINQAVVFPITEGGIKSLVAYCTSVSNEELTITELRDYLASSLPYYMIPYKFTFIPKFPLTINGKVDKTKLLENYSTDVINDSPGYLNIEYDLIALLKDLLKMEELDRDANFFDLGANSLLIAKLYNCLRTKGYHLDMLTIFQYPTVNLLIKKINSPSINDAERHFNLAVNKGRYTSRCCSLTNDRVNI